MQQKTLNTKIEGLRWPQQNSNQVSLRSGRFATVVCRHCRLPRYFAHHASASLLRPPGALGSAPNRCVLIVAKRSDGCTARLQNKKKNHSQGVVFFLVVLTGLEPMVSFCSVRFAIVAERRCRLLPPLLTTLPPRFIAHRARFGSAPHRCAVSTSMGHTGSVSRDSNTKKKRPPFRMTSSFWWCLLDSNQ